MGSLVKASLWVWIIVDAAAFSASLPEITDEKFIEECVRGHNRARSSVRPTAGDMLYMTWDEDLAMTARAWAKNCLFEHNTDLTVAWHLHPNFSFVGENLWSGYPPSLFSVTTAIESWVDEKKYYDYNRNVCTKVCGHYTQVVWARSYKVGCAAQLCLNGVRKTTFADKEGVIFVCNYAPVGNVNGRKPYKSEGAVCSGCNGTCEENLCRTPDRVLQTSAEDRASQRSINVFIVPDSCTYRGPPSWLSGPHGLHRGPVWDVSRCNCVGGYDWTTDPYSFGATSDSNFVPILIVRPIILCATFAAAYAVHHFYPNVFCYE